MSVNVLAAQKGKRRRKRKPPQPRFFTIAHRIADNSSPAIASAFTDAIGRLQAGIDEDDLVSALASGNLSTVEAAAGSGRIQAIMIGSPKLIGALEGTATLTGRAGADVLSEVTGIRATFNHTSPNVTLFARQQTANLVVGVGNDVKEAIRIVTAVGSNLGLTPTQQAVAIREAVGLPPNWAAAPTNFGNELSRGIVNKGRLLRSPVVGKTKGAIRWPQQLKAGIAAGKHLDPAWVAAQEKRYAENLLKRRALTIARTESLRAAHAGMREGWRQAVEQGVLPKTTLRVIVVTSDDRLRESHLQAALMNQNGVGLDDPFDTPWGPDMGPPFDVNCRCGEALIFGTRLL